MCIIILYILIYRMCIVITVGRCTAFVLMARFYIIMPRPPPRHYHPSSNVSPAQYYNINIIIIFVRHNDGEI